MQYKYHDLPQFDTYIWCLSISETSLSRGTRRSRDTEPSPLDPLSRDHSGVGEGSGMRERIVTGYKFQVSGRCLCPSALTP